MSPAKTPGGSGRAAASPQSAKKRKKAPASAANGGPRESATSTSRSSANGGSRGGAINAAQESAHDEKTRCAWPSSEISIAYHDREWGVPIKDDRKIFEFLVLDAAQAGLSWETILRKREGYRAAFDDFDAEKIARYDDKKIRELLENPGIIRNRLKIESAIRNARAFLALQEECGSFASYIWQFVGGKPIVNACRSMKDVRATSPESDAMSRALKKRGFCFVGSTICYAFMQAAGMVNDHFVDCFRHAELTRHMERWRIRISEIQ